MDWECGSREAKTFQKLYDRLENKYKVKMYYGDGWRGFTEVIDYNRLTQTKKETWGIENNNGRQRHWFARFRRKTCVVSRSINMVNHTINLFALFHCSKANLCQSFF